MLWPKLPAFLLRKPTRSGNHNCHLHLSHTSLNVARPWPTRSLRCRRQSQWYRTTRLDRPVHPRSRQPRHSRARLFRPNWMFKRAAGMRSFAVKDRTGPLLLQFPKDTVTTAQPHRQSPTLDLLEKISSTCHWIPHWQDEKQMTTSPRMKKQHVRYRNFTITLDLWILQVELALSEAEHTRSTILFKRMSERC